MQNKRFVALGDLIADCYYMDTKLIGIDGGSSRFNVIANLANMNRKTAIIGGCGDDKIGNYIVKRMTNLKVDTSKIFQRNRKTRVYYLTINKNTLPRITYTCSKKSPKSNENTWYEDSLEDIPYCYREVKNTDTIILDNLDDFSLEVITKFKNDKILDIGNARHLDNLQDSQISILKGKFEILQLNQSVVPYLIKRFECTSILDIYNMFKPRLMIVTYAKDGAEFVFNNIVHSKKIKNSAYELDATGAGDAFLSVFTKKYYDNLKNVNYEFVNRTFYEAIDLTSNVVQSIGARGHIYEKTPDRTINL